MTARVGLGYLLLAMGALYGGACGGGNTSSSASVEDYADAIAGSDAQSALTLSVSSGATLSLDSTAAASDAEVSAMAAFMPSGCATSSTSGNRVTYTFAECSGPYGLVRVNGSITATYTSTLKDVTVALSSSDLKVGSVSLTLMGSAVLTEPAAGPSVVFTPSGSATGPNGHTITWSGDINLAIAGSCAALDGDFMLDIDGSPFTVTATNYERCKAACPAAGGSLSFAGAKQSISIDFDGSATATYSITGGKEGELPLACAA